MSSPRFSDDVRQSKRDQAASITREHPVEKIEPMLADEGYLDLLGDAKDKPEVAQLFLRLVLVCLPPRTYGSSRVFKAGYHRMCALVYRLAPELFQGMTGEALADRLGIEYRTFKKQLTYVDGILAQRSPANTSRTSRSQSNQTSNDEND